MKETIFDAMLESALEEALRRDIEEAPEPPAPSWRQRARMRTLLKDPGRYIGRLSAKKAGRRPENPARWLAAAAIAVLLTGAAAADFALGGGEWFRRWFESSGRAAEYGETADAKLLLGMGVEMETNVVESDGMRLKIYDAVFDGQRLLMFVQAVPLDPALLEKFQGGDEEWIGFREIKCPSEDGGDGFQWFAMLPWREGAEPKEGEYPLLLQFSLGNVSEGGRVELRLKDLVFFPKESREDEIWAGEWRLPMTLRPTKVLRLAEQRSCHVNGTDWTLDSLLLSPLTLRMELHCAGTARETRWTPIKDLAIHMENGETVGLESCSYSSGIGGHRVSIRLDFGMPLNLEQVDYIHVCGEDIRLEE